MSQSETASTPERHHVMDGADTTRRLDAMVQGVIGKPLPRPEGPLKVSGRATYAAEYSDDAIGGPRAHGVLARATIPKGKVKSIDTAAIEALPGVLAVIRDERLLQVPAQGTAGAAPAQGPDEVAYLGQPIALVVAETFEQARHGAHHLEVTYEVDDSAVVDPADEAADSEFPDKKQLSQGDLEAAMAEAAHAVDVVYTTPAQNSAAMEPHAAIAAWTGEELTLWGSLQMLGFNRDELADSLGVDTERVRLISPYVGGGFGSKLGISPEAVAAAIAARQLERPVQVVMTRRQVFEATMRRSETRQRLRLAVDAEGKMTAVGHDARVSNLPGEMFSEPVTQSTHFLYAGENRGVEYELVRVHQTCAGSVRAPGEAVGMLALENAMDELAHEAGIDPIELRLQNLPDVHPESGVPFTSRRLEEALTQGAERFGWSKRAAEPAQRYENGWWIGMGVAAAARPHATKEAKVRVRLEPGGSATIETDMTDIGTGTYAILGQIAGEMLGLDPERIDVRLGDTKFPKAFGSGGSWGSGSAGSATLLACEALRSELAERLGTEPGWLVLRDGTARVEDSDEPARALADLVGDSPIEAIGHIEGGDAAEKRHHSGFGAHFAEVAVDAVSGEVRVRRMTSVFGAGRILNEKTARSQCFGGMIFGIGQALTEALQMDPRDGHVVNHDLAEYHVPVNLDVPQLEVHFVEERDDWANPLQAKGIGELGLCGAGAAVTNAIYNACGVRVRDYPATLDKIFPHLPATP